MQFNIDSDTNISIILNSIEMYISSFLMRKIVHVELLTLCSELVNNIYNHANHGTLSISFKEEEVILTAKDHGPGIHNLSLAVKEGYTTKKSLGIGLPAIIRISDDMEMITNVNGLYIKIRKVLT